MGRKRKSRKDLPQRMYFIHSAYYFVDRDGKWHPLGRNRVRALAKYGELTEAPGSLLRMGSLMDRYMKEVAPKKAPRTYKNNTNEIRTLRAVFGRMCPEEVTPQDIYAYMDARKAPTAANREKALLWMEPQVTLLQDADATRAAILAAVAELVAATRPDDLALLYYSGRGIHATSSEPASLIPFDWDDGTNAIEQKEIVAAFREAPGHGLVILDY